VGVRQDLTAKGWVLLKSKLLFFVANFISIIFFFFLAGELFAESVYL